LSCWHDMRCTDLWRHSGRQQMYTHVNELITTLDPSIAWLRRIFSWNYSNDNVLSPRSPGGGDDHIEFKMSFWVVWQNENSEMLKLRVAFRGEEFFCNWTKRNERLQTLALLHQFRWVKGRTDSALRSWSSRPSPPSTGCTSDWYMSLSDGHFGGLSSLLLFFFVATKPDEPILFWSQCFSGRTGIITFVSPWPIVL
jgi:hypothetical protein